MTSRIRMATADSIRTHYDRVWSRRKIAPELEGDRATVDRYASKPAKVTAGTLPVTDPGTGGGDSKPAISTAGISGRRSVCAGDAVWIGEQVEAGLSAQRIFQDMREERGHLGAYESVKRFVRRLRQTDPRRYYRIEAFARHYGLAILPTRPKTPLHKGKIKRGIGYVKGNTPGVR